MGETLNGSTKKSYGLRKVSSSMRKWDMFCKILILIDDLATASFISIPFFSTVYGRKAESY
jgi:hypothetical protein